MSTITLPTSITTQTAIVAGNTYILQGNTIISGAANPPFTAAANQGVGTVIDGRGYIVTISGITNFAGLFSSNHSRNLSGITIQNFTIATRDSSFGGTSHTAWVCSGTDTGGGPNNVTLCNILNTAEVTGTGDNGALLGFNSLNCRLFNCGNVGTLNVAGGSMVAGQPNGCTASNCYNTSPVPEYGGGIFGSVSTNCTAVNCYNTGTVTGTNNKGPIFSLFNPTNGGAINCYSTRSTIQGTGVVATNCANPNTGVWSDVSATASRNGGNGLTGTPFYNPDATTSVTFPSVGSVWYSTGINTPFLLSATIPPCFVAGTRILTPTGYSCVETLKDHDEIVTSDGRTVSIKVYKTTIETTDEDTAPYVIPKDAFGLNNPDEDLHVSGKHIIQDGRGVWQAPKYLSCARQYGIGSPMTYYHIECPDYFHDDLVANGAVVESFRNKQGTSEVSYEYSEKLWGYVRVMPLETGFADKHVLNCC